MPCTSGGLKAAGDSLLDESVVYDMVERSDELDELDDLAIM